MENSIDKKPKYFVLDVDGVMTTGQMYYTKDGKTMKVFGDADSDALCLLRNYLNIMFVAGDKRGFAISKKRIVDDMGFSLELVSTIKRVDYLKEKLKDLSQVIYMGDGIFDHYVFKEVGYSICPFNGFYLAKERADFVTRSKSGERAVAEACLHIMEKFFEPFDPDKLPEKFQSQIGWQV